VCVYVPSIAERREIFSSPEQSIKMFTTNGTFWSLSSSLNAKTFYFSLFAAKEGKVEGWRNGGICNNFFCDYEDFDAKQKGENLLILYQA
jgi:hypothetical protein